MRYKWDKKYLYWGITAFLVIAACILFYALLNRSSMFLSAFSVVIKAVSPFIYGILIAYLLGKVSDLLEENIFQRLCGRWFRSPVTGKKASRIFSILVSMLLAIAVLGGMVALIAPELYKSVENLVVMVPSYATSIVEWAEKTLSSYPDIEKFTVKVIGSVSDGLMNWIKTDLLPQTNDFVTRLTSGVFSVLKGILNVLIGFVISVYIMYHKETFRAQLKKILYGLFSAKRANRVVRELSFVKKAFGDFIVGKIIDSVIIGVLCYISLSILRMPYAALVSLIVGVTNVIPVFGPFIGAIPSAALILLESPLKCLIFVIFIIILQQVDGNIIGPKILGSSTGLSGFWIMFAILFFGGIFGVVGMLLGVPLMAVIYHAVVNGNERHLKKKNLPLTTEEFRKISYIDEDSGKPIYYFESPKGKESKKKIKENEKNRCPAEKDHKDEKTDSDQ